MNKQENKNILDMRREMLRLYAVGGIQSLGTLALAAAAVGGMRSGEHLTMLMIVGAASFLGGMALDNIVAGNAAWRRINEMKNQNQQNKTR